MARFYGGVSGQARSEVTRLGSAASGISTFAQGWHSGVSVSGGDLRGDYAQRPQDVDYFNVRVTSGSSYRGFSTTIAQLIGDTLTLYHPISGRVLAKTKLKELS